MWVHLLNISGQAMDFHFSMWVMEGETNRRHVSPLLMHMWDLERVSHALSYLDILLRENCAYFFFEFSVPVSIGECAISGVQVCYQLKKKKKIFGNDRSVLDYCSFKIKMSLFLLLQWNNVKSLPLSLLNQEIILVIGYVAVTLGSTQPQEVILKKKKKYFRTSGS